MKRVSFALKRVWKIARSGDRAYKDLRLKANPGCRVPSRGFRWQFQNALLAILLSGLPAVGQGLVSFYNTPTSLVALYRDPAGGPVSVQWDPGMYYFGLLSAPLGATNLNQFTFTGVYATNEAVIGRFSGGTQQVPGWPPGTFMSFMVAGWSSNLGHDWQPAWLSGSFDGNGLFGLSGLGAGPAGGFDGTNSGFALPIFGGATGLESGFALYPAPIISLKPFVNLDFESATLLPVGVSGQTVQLAAGFPGWTVSINSPIDSNALYNNMYLDSAGIGIVDTNAQLLATAVIGGRYTAFLQSGLGYTPAGAVVSDTTLSQTGLVPPYVQSLQFKAKTFFDPSGRFAVGLGGQILPLRTLATATNYTLYGADVSPWAGQLAQLSFTVFGEKPHVNVAVRGELS
jgi:hypothetical protein